MAESSAATLIQYQYQYSNTAPVPVLWTVRIINGSGEK